MGNTKEQISEQIKTEFELMISKYNDDGILPSDRTIAKFSQLIYQRDMGDSKKYDIEMMAVARGIIQGMTIMKNIIERKN